MYVYEWIYADKVGKLFTIQFVFEFEELKSNTSVQLIQPPTNLTHNQLLPLNFFCCCCCSSEFRDSIQNLNPRVIEFSCFFITFRIIPYVLIQRTLAFPYTRSITNSLADTHHNRKGKAKGEWNRRAPTEVLVGTLTDRIVEWDLLNHHMFEIVQDSLSAIHQWEIMSPQFHKHRETTLQLLHTSIVGRVQPADRYARTLLLNMLSHQQALKVCVQWSTSLSFNKTIRQLQVVKR